MLSTHQIYFQKNHARPTMHPQMKYKSPKATETVLDKTLSIREKPSEI